MAYNVIMLPAAEDDYGEILLYFEKQFDSKQAIQTFVKDFGEVFVPPCGKIRTFTVIPAMKDSDNAGIISF